MRAPKANVRKRDTALLCVGGLSLAPVCFFAFFAPQLVEQDASGAFWVAGAGVLAACAAVAILPLVYQAVQNNVGVSLGKYHFPLAFMTLASAGFVVLTGCGSIWFSGLIARLVTTISFALCVLCLLIFFSVVSSIHSRMTTQTSAAGVGNGLFAVLGAALVAAAYVASGILNASSAIAFCAQIAAILQLVSGLCVYFASAQYMPRFIRLEEPSNCAFKEKYSRFFALFSQKKTAATATGHFLQTAAVSVMCLFMGLQLSGELSSLWLFVGFAAGFALFAAIGFKTVSQPNVAALSFAAGLLSVGASAAVLVGFLISPVLDEPWTIYSVIGAAAVGSGAGLQRAANQYRAQEAVLRGESTHGAFGSLHSVLVVCAFALALLLAIGGAYVMLYAVVALGIAASIAAILGRVRDDALAMPELDDRVTQEIMQNIKLRQSDEERLADLIASIEIDEENRL